MSDNISRKDFLQRLAFGGASLALFPWLAGCTSEKQKEAAGEKARLGIIGTGSRGRFHLANLLEDPSAQIVALCDDFRPHLDEASAMCPSARRYTDYRRLLEDPDVDGVIICTPLSMHAQMTIDALAAGKHTFCEKAMAHTPEQ